MSTMINQVDNANVYLNGKSFLGKAKTIKLPEFEVEFIEHDNLGLAGKIKLPGKINAMEGEITWDGFYQDVAKLALNPFKTTQLMVRANVRTFNSQGETAEVPLVMTLNVNFNKVNLGEYKKEATEFVMSFQAQSIKQVLDGQEVLFYDAFSNQYRVAGSDVLNKFRSNLGA